MLRNLKIIGVPSDLGQNRRGVDMGPSAIRYADINGRLAKLGHQVEDMGNIIVPTPEMYEVDDVHLKYLKEVVAVCNELCQTVTQVMRAGYTPIILGGDHSVSIGSIAGIANIHSSFGVIWFDAHGDMNTDKTTPSGNIHGMPLAASLGLGHPQLVGLGGKQPKLDPAHVVLIGVRSIDPDEARLIKECGIHWFTMSDIDTLGIAEVMQEAIEIAGLGTDGIHLSLDIDALDPLFAPGVGTPVNGGVTYREGHLAMELLAVSGKVLSVDVVEANPILDDKNRTSRMAVELLESLFGKTILS